ncbi:MAG TPA: sulfite exporter TauE/SafE family protein [Holophagaceae bacterium]|nr:sulfite exporter TauE/SafE family protein [Holophagaceae bacterium]
MQVSWLAQFLAGAGSGLAGGLLSGLFGIGGGIVLVPLLGLALHLDQHRAQGVTLAAMLLPIGLPAVLHYRKAGVPIHWPLVWILILGFLAGVLAGSELANLLPERPLRFAFVVFLLVMAVWTLRGWRGGAEGIDPASLPAARLALPGVAIGSAAGAASGLLGIGGGVVIIPALALWLGLPQRQAQVISLVVMLLPIRLPGVLIYAKAQGGLPWVLLGGVAVGFGLGAGLGARLAMRLSGPRLRAAFAGLMLVMAVLLAMRT